MTQTILITGASSGIGKATALFFHDKGWNVVATLRDPAQAGDLAALPRVLVTRLDVTDGASITAAVGEAQARFGGIDVLLNNAGYGVVGEFHYVHHQPDGTPYADPNAKKGGRLRVGLSGTFDSLNPFNVKSGTAAQGLVGNVFQTLMARSQDEPFTLYPLIAKSIEIDPARTRLTFHLDPRAHFSDGKPITAADWVYSWKRILELDPGNVANVLLHEVGAHYGMEQMLGASLYRQLLSEIEAKAK